MAYFPNFNDPSYGDYPADPTQTGGLGLSSQAPRGILGGGYSNLLDPSIALPAAAAMIGGRNLQESLSGAFAAATPGIVNMRKRTALNAWLKAKSSGDPAALKQATDALYQADPAIAESMAVNEMTPHRQFTQIGQSVMGQPQYGWVDPVAGSVEPVAQSGGIGGGAADAGAGSGSSGKLYDSLPKPQQAQVDQLIQGKIPYPSGYQLSKSPYWNAITAAAEERAQALGVPLDAAAYPTRLATKKAFTTGLPAQSITAASAAIGHLGSLDKAADKLGNWDGIPLINYAYNAARNGVLNASGAATDLQTFNAIKSKYSQEITKFYRATGGSDSDISEAMGQLDSARSPSELHATIRAQVVLLKSKVSAMQEQWHNGMGPNEPDFPLISKEAQTVLDRIAPQETQTATDGGGAPVKITGDADFNALPSGTHFVGPDGHERVKP